MGIKNKFEERLKKELLLKIASIVETEYIYDRIEKEINKIKSYILNKLVMDEISVEEVVYLIENYNYSEILGINLEDLISGELIDRIYEISSDTITKEELEKILDPKFTEEYRYSSYIITEDDIEDIEQAKKIIRKILKENPKYVETIKNSLDGIFKFVLL